MTFETLNAARVEAVWDALARHVQPAGHHEAPVRDALGHVLAQDAFSAHDFPPFDRAMMDGYAVRAGDFSDGAATLRRLELVRAGAERLPRVEPGTCAQINTGAPIPPGADAVVMVEHSREVGDGGVELSDAPQPGQHIDSQGAHVRRGDALVRAGTRIGPGTLAALVAGGVVRVRVHNRPRVAILGTGDELVAGGEALRRGQIHDSNSVGLAQLVSAAGADPAWIRRCVDERGEQLEALRRGIDSDLLCVTGGMSKGSHDLVPALLEELGVQWLVTSLHMKPGKPLRIGRAPNGCWAVGLPGNPVSCMVCFLLFARCILDGLQGLAVGKPPHLNGRLDADLPACGGRPMYQPATWSVGADGCPYVSPVAWRGSGDPFGMAVANALIHRPQRAPAAFRGESVPFVPLDLPR